MSRSLSQSFGVHRAIAIACIGRTAFAFAALLLATAVNSNAYAFTDNFSDANDTANPAWTHLDGLVLSDGQTWDASTGQYRLIGPSNGYTLGANGDLGFVGSYVPTSFTDVKVTADFVQPATGSAYGITARIDGNNIFNELRGYAYCYEPYSAGGLGEMVIYRMTGLQLDDMGSQQVTLDLTNKDYTFSLEIIGNQLHGKVFEIGGGMVAEKTATDSTYTSGFSGLFAYAGSSRNAAADFTVDNFSSQAPVSLPGDFDNDTDVDGNDLAIWKSAFGITALGDADEDEDSDGNDFLIWQRNYTGTLVPIGVTVAAVPEPVAVAMTAPIFLLLAAHRRRKIDA